MPDIELLSGPWVGHLVDLVRSARRDLYLVSPFLRREPLELIARTVEEFPSDAHPVVQVITNLHESSLLNKSLDVAALSRFADSRAAIITSANLTNGGLWRNREYGVLLRDEETVRELRRDMRDFARLGNVVERPMLAELVRETERLLVAQVETERTVDREAQTRLRKLLAGTRDLVLQARARGKTTNGILADTVLYLLKRHGPLSTRSLHPHIQALHPDLCDDAIDRVIDGVHFGKKWKHHVRNAQQQLRRQGRIERLADGRWALSDSGQRD